ncbi:MULTISPECIES: sporulation integral membrane protein YtvI [Heyndrickxia]|uniref:sporulation integral membrane protein YtvI n=1 Tax=Heyndrickxia TaxID=2837504 RepID=UPI00039AFA94|nr:sporulation integral membrane protein YtvI [Heyndrickxia oleronia]NYV64353.1 sporulation integral membrane protein YtvI [Bacillus sp. Gen3]OJH17429.1 sporulation integral membrane protein YtvI [Bacillus obstructivus]MBU5212538.1 sporulation integral membrane protein YtvI [Heyndrickxia oleronia]MCI1590147.1 sporulation integral membrane protein YtvI [Heyndrickxia oleronia]MCI1613201.1 sporulation integral membrane protein YtvI [Heyndrickxia oleronia]
MNPVYVNRTIRFLIVLGIVLGGAFIFYFVSKVTYPFLIAIVIALLINPLVNFLERKARFPRALAVIVSIILIISIFIGLITLLIAEIVSGTNYLADVVPKHVNTLVEYIEDFIAGQVLPIYNQAASLFKNLDAGQQDTIMTNIQTAGQKIASSAGNFLQNFFLKLPALVSWIPNAATVLVFSLLATFFISKDWNRLSRFSGKLLPERAMKSFRTVITDLKKALFGFVRAQLTLISITLVIVLIGLLILRVDYAITIALVSGIVDILPYLGTGVVFIPWIIYEAIVGNIPLAIGLGVLYTVVVVQRQLMEPKILSSSIGLNPLATLIALFVGFKLVGFLGLILGPVTLVIITTLHRANVFQDIWNFILGKPNVIKK